MLLDTYLGNVGVSFGHGASIDPKCAHRLIYDEHVDVVVQIIDSRTIKVRVETTREVAHAIER